MSKTAIVLLNLGGPDSPQSIRPFLINFFMDPNIIRLPIPFRCILAWMIANRRTKKEAGESYGELGGSSPLLENSKAQAKALEKLIKAQDKDNKYKTFICMRYWHPMSPQVVREVRDWGADNIVLLPLYPQYSTTTTRSSFQVWMKAALEAGINIPTKLVCCYPWEEGFIKASAESVKLQYEKAIEETGKKPRILFSAHGLPEKIVKDGDPYQWQCEETARRIMDVLNLDDPDWHVCYQSKVGPQKWLGPSTEDSIEKAAEDQVPVVILPHAFTQEHVETLVELDVEYREIAEEHKIPGYYRAHTVGVNELYIEGLAKLVLESAKHPDIAPAGGKALCPSGFKECCMNEYNKTTLFEEAK